MKNYNGKVFREKSLMFNFIFILLMFAVTQIIGIIVCFNYGDMNIFVNLIIILALNYILYKALRF